MHIITCLTTLSFGITLFIGGYVFFSNPKSSVNRLFALFSLSIAIWNLGLLFMIPAPDEHSALLWFRFGASSWSILEALFLHFILTLTRNEELKRNRWILPLIYLPALILWYPSVFGMKIVAGFEHSDLGWIYVMAETSAWSIANNLYIIGCFIISLFLLLLWGRKAEHPAQRRQAFVIFLSV